MQRGWGAQRDPGRREGLLGCLARYRIHRPLEAGGARWRELEADLCAALGLRGLAWLPLGGVREEELPHSTGLPPRRVDWPWVARLTPGEVRRIREGARQRSPRLDACEADEIWVRGREAGLPPGVLWILPPQGGEWGRGALDTQEWVALADLLADLYRFRPARVEGGGRGSDGQGESSPDQAGLLHDLRGQLTLALLELERRGGVGGGNASVLALLRSARDLCSAGMEGRPLVRSLELRPLLLAEARYLADLARGASGGGGVGVRVRCPAGLTVVADRSRLARVVRNLLVNAAEASRPPSRVQIEGRALPDGRVSIVVEDQGEGMDPVRLAEYLSPERASGGGSGWGGASLVSCLQALGAECAIESAPGAGTRVEVSLPVAAPFPAASTPIGQGSRSRTSRSGQASVQS